jgi:site-specific recombinase XerC
MIFRTGQQHKTKQVSGWDMDDLTYTLRQLCRRNRDGSHNTQADRIRSLGLIARQLREVGFRQMKAPSLKGKHVLALLDRWQGEGLSPGTIKNRLAHLRWWAEKIGKAGILPADNTQLGVAERRFVTNVSKAQELGTDLGKITDPHVRMSLQLQSAFGLRREEAIKFQPKYADQGDHILLKGSWTKGGRDRSVPITTSQQREVLDAAHQLAGAGSLIPAHKTYIQQRNTYDGQCKAAGLSHMHGLRHHYAQSRYVALTGWKAPAAGGISSKELTPMQRSQDRTARQIISRELGHERTQITATYLGR